MSAKISALPAVSSLALSDIFPVVQGGVNKKASVADLLTRGFTVHIDDFGAIGDGITDDHQAFVDALQALNDLNDDGYGTLVLGAKTYAVESTIAMQSGVTVVGYGRDWTSIKRLADVAIFTLSSCNDVILHDFSLDANDGEGFSTTLINSAGSSNGSLQRIYAFGIQGLGVTLSASNGMVLEDVNLEASGSVSGGTGLFLDSCSNLVIRNTQIFGFDNYGIDIGSCAIQASGLTLNANAVAINSLGISNSVLTGTIVDSSVGVADSGSSKSAFLFVINGVTTPSSIPDGGSNFVNLCNISESHEVVATIENVDFMTAADYPSSVTFVSGNTYFLDKVIVLCNLMDSVPASPPLLGIGVTGLFPNSKTLTFTSSGLREIFDTFDDDSFYGAGNVPSVQVQSPASGGVTILSGTVVMIFSRIKSS